jgi:hypothetical protein
MAGGVNCVLDADLEAALVAALQDEGIDAAALTEASPNPARGSRPSWRLAFQRASGDLLLTFAKSDVGTWRSEDPYRRGVAYERDVYRRVLVRHPGVSPGFACAMEFEGESWLLVEYIEGLLRLEKTDGRIELSLAAEKIGQLHRSTMGIRDPHLQHYGRDMIEEWFSRAEANLVDAGVEDASRVLSTALQAWVVDVLGGQAQSLVHGDLYPANVMCRPGSVWLVDWEAAGIGAGALDLAALVEGWPARHGMRAMAAYRAATGHSAADVRESLTAASVWLCARFLGHRIDVVATPHGRWRLGMLRSVEDGRRAAARSGG